MPNKFNRFNLINGPRLQIEATASQTSLGNSILQICENNRWKLWPNIIRCHTYLVSWPRNYPLICYVLQNYPPMTMSCYQTRKNARPQRNNCSKKLDLDKYYYLEWFQRIMLRYKTFFWYKNSILIKTWTYWTTLVTLERNLEFYIYILNSFFLMEDVSDEKSPFSVNLM